VGYNWHSQASKPIMKVDNGAEQLLELGMVPIIYLKPLGNTRPDAIWWVKKAVAKEEVEAGRAVYESLVYD
jgi:hypothetical protein